MSSQLRTRVPIPPDRVLSSYSPGDYLYVIYWTFWAPHMFAEYGNYLLLMYRNQMPPRRPGWNEWDRWRASGAGPREFLDIVFRVCVLLCAGLAAVNTISVFPLFPDMAEQAVAESVVYVLIFSLILLLSLWISSLGRASSDNVGTRLEVILPGTLLPAIWFLALWWARYQQVYLARPSLATAIIFAFWGFAAGLLVNFVLGQIRFEFRSAVAAVVVCAVPIGLAYLALVAIGSTDPVTMWDGVHTDLRNTWVWWSVGFLLGMLRLIEWLLLQTVVPRPGTSSWRRSHAWWTPGATLVQDQGLGEALHDQLHSDWRQGIDIAKEVSRLSRQQYPIVKAARRSLVDTRAEELPELLMSICDSGAAFAVEAIVPPLYKKRQGSGPPPAARPLRTQQQQQQEADLAAILHQLDDPPIFQRDTPEQALQAVCWYIVQGRLFQAVDTIDQLLQDRTRSAPIVDTPAFQELRYLVACYLALQDLKTLAGSPTPKLPSRPDTCLRPKAWAIIDRFIVTSHWLWRSQRCPTLASDYCLERFATSLAKIEKDAKASTLAERRLTLATCELWRRKMPKLLAGRSSVWHFVPAELRPWNVVYLELGTLCPWQQAAPEFHRCWQPGSTTLALIDSQPDTGAHQAVEAAINTHRVPSVLATCDLAKWEKTPAGLAGICADLCQAVADSLHATDKLPEPAGMSALTPDTTFTLIKDLCDAAPQRCVVLLLENAHLYSNLSQPNFAGSDANKMLQRLEREINNMAVAVDGSGSDQLWLQLVPTLSPDLQSCRVQVHLLSRSGANWWLRRQFYPSGLYFEPSGVDRIYQLTGGHPSLLDSLSRCIALNYNDQTPAAPRCPIIDTHAVDAAAGTRDYLTAVAACSGALAHKLSHPNNCIRRHLLYTLAFVNVTGNRSVSVAEIASRNTGHPGLDAGSILNTLDSFEQGEVVEVEDSTKVGGDRCYRLRSLSFARWIEQQGPDLPSP